MNLYLKDKKPASLYETHDLFRSLPEERNYALCYFFCSCEAVGGTMKDALDAATALELVHNFTLVHDDIMDHDELAAWKRDRL